VTLVVALAGYRLFRLIGRDTITAPWRESLPERVRTPVECGWCAGSWATFAVAFVARNHLPRPWPVAAFAAAGLAGLIAFAEGTVTTLIEEGA
jgi:hypothetical protein